MYSYPHWASTIIRVKPSVVYINMGLSALDISRLVFMVGFILLARSPICRAMAAKT